MGNSPYRISNTQPQTTFINSLENHIYIDQIDNQDNSDNQSTSTVDFDRTPQNNSQPYITEVYARRKCRRRGIIVARTSKSFDETEIQMENQNSV